MVQQRGFVRGSGNSDARGAQELCAFSGVYLHHSQKNVGLLPVKDAATNFLVGVVTDRDLIVRIVAKGLHASATPVGIALSGPAVAMVYEDADLAAAERLMIDRGVRRVLVSRRSDNLLVGVLSVDDFAMAGFRRRAGEARSLSHPSPHFANAPLHRYCAQRRPALRQSGASTLRSSPAPPPHPQCRRPPPRPPCTRCVTS